MHNGGSTIRSYSSYVGGRDIGSDRYVYTVGSRPMLEDVFAGLTLKRRLEQGRLDVSGAGGSVVGRCAVADAETAELALASAAAAAPVWARVPLKTRMRLVEGLRMRLREGHAELVDLLIAEGNPRALAEWQVAGMIEVTGEQSLGWCVEQMHREFREGNRRMVIRRVPDGVVCVNPPQNAPAASALFGAMAMLAGNAVVVRAPRSNPLGVMYLLRDLVVPVLDEIGAPPGTLNVFCARPGPTIQSWLDSPHVDDIFYTGGVERGLELQAECVARGKKPILELAGNDCVVIWRDADVDLAVEALIECFYGSGQICMVPNQVVVHPGVADALVDRLCAAVSEVRPGHCDEQGVLLSPVLRSERFFGYVRDAVASGARLLHGGRRLEVDGSASDTGPFLEPTVLRVEGMAACRDLAVVRDETFFPLLPIVVAEWATDRELLDRMIEFVNSNPYGLRNSLWANDDSVITEFVERVGNGGLLKVNDSHIGFVPHLPTHGGTGLTGGVFGEANYPMLRTSHLQGVSIASGVRPSEAVLGAYRALSGA